MQDAYVDEITPEEQAILSGEAPPEPEKAKEPENPAEPEKEPVKEPEKEPEKAPEKEPEAAKAETDLTPDESKAAESKGLKLIEEHGRKYLVDDDGAKIPVKRWKEHFWETSTAIETLRQENSTLKEKQDLLKKLGPDVYYKLNPAEAPEGWKPQEEKKAAPAQTQQQPTRESLDNLIIKGGDYAGMTLGQVWELNPKEASRMEWDYLDRVKTAQTQQRQQAETQERERESDITRFGMARAKELFGIEDIKALKPEHHLKLTEIGNKVIEFQYSTGRQGYSLEDAYHIMTSDERTNKQIESAVANALKGLQKSGPTSIDTGGGGDVKPSGWEAVAKMTPAQLESHLDGMSDAETTKFLTEAPASIRAKHPSMPWK